MYCFENEVHMKFLSFGRFGLMAAFASSAYCYELADPLATEINPTWQKYTSDISAYFTEEGSGDSVYFVVDRGDHRDPLFLTLSNPQDPSDIALFLEECEKFIETQPRKIGIVAAGRSFQPQVKQWLDHLVSSHNPSEPAPLAMFGHPPVQVIKETSVPSPRIVLSYHFNLPEAKTFRDLRKLWVMELVQQMTMQRLVRDGIFSSHSFDARNFLLPSSSLRIALPYDEPTWQKNLTLTLQKMKEIEEIGFTQDEMLAVKKECLFLIQELQKEKEATQNLFQAHTFLRGVNSLSYAEFLDAAPSLLESITPLDIAIAMRECFSHEHRVISCESPDEMHPNWVAEASQIIDLVEMKQPEPATMPAAMIPPSGPSLFEQLPLYDHEKTMIHKMIETIAKDNVIKLGLKRKTMEKRGKKIRHVHPLRFLGYIFSTPHLKHCMREISRSSFKWNGFIDGMKDRIEEEARRGGLLPHIHEFARLCNADENRCRHYIQKRDWEGLVRCLL